MGVMRPKVLSDAIHWRYLRYHYEAGAIVKVESLGKRCLVVPSDCQLLETDVWTTIRFSRVVA